MGALYQINETLEQNDLSEQIKRFPIQYQRAVRDIVENNNYAADLLWSYPAVIFALAARVGSDRDRAKTLRLINEGRSLRDIGSSMGLPYWLRKAPAEAFYYRNLWFPKCEEFNRKLSGAFPAKPVEMVNWLHLVPLAVRYGHQDFALWFARQKIFNGKNAVAKRIYGMAAYAWFSEHPYYYAGSLIDQPWHADMGFKTLRRLTGQWLRRIKSEVLIGKGVTDSWLRPGCVNGYSFICLMSNTDLREEGRVMKNCIASYAYELASNKSRIFSIQKKGEHVATLEIIADPANPKRPLINELEAPGNKEASEAIWRATFKWLGQQVGYSLPRKFKPKPDSTIWRRLWGPYLDKKGNVPFLPEFVKEQELDEVFEKLII